MSIESFAENISSKLDILKLEHRTCVNYLSPKGDCNICIERCPVDGIDIENGLSFKSSCTRCGVCSTYCPTGSISVNSPTENYIYNKINKINQNSKSDIVINCFETYKDDKSIINIPCVGVLSLEILLYLKSIKNNVQVIVGDECESCSKKFGYKSYNDKLIYADEILEKLGKKSYAIKNDPNIPKNINSPKPSSDEINAERRAFLRSVFVGIKNIPKKTIDNFLGKENEEEIVKTTKAYKYEILEKLLKDFNGEEDFKLNLRSFPEFKNSCYFCKACIKMCPEKALNLEENVITLDKEKCTGCGLCEDICFHKSIKMRTDFISDYKSNKLEYIEGKEITCTSCGRTIVTQIGDKCSRCS